MSLVAMVTLLPLLVKVTEQENFNQKPDKP